MDTSILSQELEPLKAQIKVVQGRAEALAEELKQAQIASDVFAEDKRRFAALADVCAALDNLTEMGAEDLFWEEVPGVVSPTMHLDRIRDRIRDFEDGIRAGQAHQEAIKEKINACLDELEFLHVEVHDAYAREERRQEEFVLERELSPVPYRMAIMPWTNNGETERIFRRSILVAMLLCLLFGGLIPLVAVPVPDRTAVVVEIPERLAMLVKKEPPKPEPPPVPEKLPEEAKPEPEKEKPEKPKNKQPEKEKVNVASADNAKTKAARKKAESTGVLAFKNTFSDLMEETPVAKLGTEARISKDTPRAAGQARATRSLVAMQGKGTSGGIGVASTSRNVGTGGKGNADQIGGIGFSRVESSVAGLAEEGGRPVSDGPGPARTDEEIQIVFDRYKATLYRIYNKELRKDPTLRGKMLLRLTIEPSGAVSLCKVESTDLASKELVAQIVERVEKFNFGPKEGVPKTTILYPIDFLPAG